MGNMSYCRFENTYNDLLDCVRAIEEGEEDGGASLSESELRFAKLMAELCGEYIGAFESSPPQPKEME